MRTAGDSSPRWKGADLVTAGVASCDAAASAATTPVVGSKGGPGSAEDGGRSGRPLRKQIRYWGRSRSATRRRWDTKVRCSQRRPSPACSELGGKLAAAPLRQRPLSWPSVAARGQTAGDHGCRRPRSCVLFRSVSLAMVKDVGWRVGAHRVASSDRRSSPFRDDAWEHSKTASR